MHLVLTLLLAAEPSAAERTAAVQELERVAQLVRSMPPQREGDACELPKGATGGVEFFALELATISAGARRAEWRQACPDSFVTSWRPGPWLALAYPAFNAPLDPVAAPKTRWLVVTRNACDPGPTRVVVDVVLVELGSPRVTCGFRVVASDEWGAGFSELLYAETARHKLVAQLERQFGTTPK